MIKIAIVDDEKQSVNSVKDYIRTYAKESNESFELDEYDNGLKFLDNYKQQYNIIFMDIKMPILNGMEVAKLLRQTDDNVCIIFFTTMMQLAIKGYEVNAFDFIVKPVSYSVFSQKLKKALIRCKKEQNSEITIKLKNGFKRVDVSAIYFIESIGHTLVYNTMDGIIEVSRSGTLKETEALLSGNNFSRCSNSHIVNLKHIQSMQNNIITINGVDIFVTRTKRKTFYADLAKYLGGDLK